MRVVLPGRLSIPVSVGGVAVSPGDLVIGDVDGIVVIPRQEVEAALEAAGKKLAAERQRIDEINAGVLVSPCQLTARFIADIWRVQSLHRGVARRAGRATFGWQRTP